MIPMLFDKQEVGILLIFIHIEHAFCICPFLVTFFSATIDGRNLIFGNKLFIGTPYCGKRFFDPSDSYFLFVEEHWWNFSKLYLIPTY
jgi:hypothetical protein